MKCDICEEQAVSHVEWGQDQRQQGNLCGHCIRDAWDAVHNQVKAGICWWQQQPIENG